MATEKSKVIGVRVSPEMAAKLQATAKDRGLTVSALLLDPWQDDAHLGPTVNLDIPNEAHARLTLSAKRRGLTLSAYILSELLEPVAAVKPGERANGRAAKPETAKKEPATRIDTVRGVLVPVSAIKGDPIKPDPFLAGMRREPEVSLRKEGRAVPSPQKLLRRDVDTAVHHTAGPVLKSAVPPRLKGEARAVPKRR